tara:strand:+ start:276 stop:899 length:624 start_codon:yes stop_codon:yes gene_type:complete
MRPKVAILARVSTQAQETDRQVTELINEAETRGWDVIKVIREVASGAASSRTGIDEALELAESGKVSKILVHEISRIARKNSAAHDFLERLTKIGVSIYLHSYRLETLLPGGKRNDAASLIYSVMSDMARAEREMLRDRVASGLAEARRKGVRLGRPPGSGKLSKEKLLAKHKDIVEAIKLGGGIRAIARATGKSANTVMKVKSMVA